MKHVCVIGGGLAGLSSAVYLSTRGYKVELIEASPKLGGRTYTLHNPAFDDYYDNGQHILMGCYLESIAFLKTLGTFDKLHSQVALNVNFVERGGRIACLNIPKRGYPLNLMLGFLIYKGLAIEDRLKVIDFFLDLLCVFEEDLSGMTAYEWLKKEKQSDRALKAFWEILVVAALNTSIRRASAEIFCRILKRIFFLGRDSAAILIPSPDLNALFITPSQKIIESYKNKITLSEKVQKIEFEESNAVRILTNKRAVSGFDYLILAVPVHAVQKIQFTGLNQSLLFPKLEYAPILNMHLWLSENPFAQKFYGLIGSDVQWLFNHGKHISLTSSSAENLIGLDNGEIKKHFCTELGSFFPLFRQEYAADSMVIKEKRATFIPDISSNLNRKENIGSFRNVAFAGDWVDNDLPATIESAVLSGKSAFEKASSFLAQ